MHASFEWMKENEHKFNDNLLQSRSPLSKAVSKVGLQSSAGACETLTAETRQFLQEQWEQVVLPVSGVKDYAGMRRALAAEMACAAKDDSKHTEHASAMP